MLEQSIKLGQYVLQRRDITFAPITLFYFIINNKE